MIYILGIVGIIVVISLISAVGRSGDRVAAAHANVEWERRMLSRMAAYRDFIRREGDESWQKLSDNELEDMIANAMRGFASDIAGARALVKMTFWVAGAAVVCGLLFFLDDLQGVARGMSMPIFFALWFAAVLGTGFVAALVVSYWREKSIEKKWSRGWDVNKLIV